MRTTLKITTIFTLLLTLSGCHIYESGDHVLVHPDKTQPPFGAKVISETSYGYEVEVHDTYEIIEVSTGDVLKQVITESDVGLAQFKWRDANPDWEKNGKADPVKVTKKENVKSQIFYLAVVPFILISLCYLHPAFAILAVPYTLWAICVYGLAQFLIIFLFFIVVSAVMVALFQILIGPGTSHGMGVGAVIWIILVLMFLIV